MTHPGSAPPAQVKLANNKLETLEGLPAALSPYLLMNMCSTLQVRLLLLLLLLLLVIAQPKRCLLFR